MCFIVLDEMRVEELFLYGVKFEKVLWKRVFILDVFSFLVDGFFFVRFCVCFFCFVFVLVSGVVFV